MFRFLSFLFISGLIFVFKLSYAGDKENLLNSFQELSSQIKSSGIIDYKNGCSNCTSSSLNYIKTILISKDNNQKIELSVLSEEEATLAFNEIIKRKDIPFDFFDGCFAKAHKIGVILEERGIISGKAFIEGEFPVVLSLDAKQYFDMIDNPKWSYHVAPVVMVKKGSEIIPYVFDPYFFKKPVPQVEWKKKVMENPTARLQREYYTNRFSYDTRDRKKILKKHNQDFLDDADMVNEQLTITFERYKDELEMRKEEEVK
jgi:hypothetical protein